MTIRDRVRVFADQAAPELDIQLADDVDVLIIAMPLNKALVDANGGRRRPAASSRGAAREPTP